MEWSDKTRIRFSVTFQEREISYEAVATLDRNRVRDGERLELFRNSQFVISHPKAISFATNFFVGYGEHNFGQINLQRAKGNLNVQATPPAALLTIRGPEFSLTLSNSSGTNLTVPTDRYTVRAEYTYWKKVEEVSVSPGFAAAANFAPDLGVLKITCNKPNVSFQLKNATGSQVESGKLPSEIAGLPPSSYTLVSQYRNFEAQQSINLKGNETNNVNVEFVYGTAEFITEPPGATVSSGSGRNFGTTPLVVQDLPVGTLGFSLKREGFESVQSTLIIKADETSSFRTNMVDSRYVQAVADARDLRASGYFSRAIASLELALQDWPEGIEARRLLSDYKKTIAAQNEEQSKKPEESLDETKRVARFSQSRLAFDALAAKFLDADLFNRQDLTTSKKVKEVAEIISKCLRTGSPALKVSDISWENPETFTTFAKLEVPGGFRYCLIVGGQSRDDQTVIIYEVLEYEVRPGSNENPPPMLAIHPKRVGELSESRQTRLKEGVQSFSERIQQALGK